MQILSAAVLALTLAGLAPVGELKNLNPSGLSGVAPWGSPEVSVHYHGGQWVAAFTGGKNRRTAVYLRKYSSEDGWSETIPVSPEDRLLDSHPSLWIDEAGAYHCVWTTRAGRGRYQVYYARLDPGAEGFTEPHLFSTGSGLVPPQLTGDGLGNLLVYYFNNTSEDRRGRIFVFVSRDGGKSWLPSDPNYPKEKRKGRARELRGALLPDGGLGLVWLDQTPGGVSVVFNRTLDGGKSWFEEPVSVSRNPAVAASNPRLLMAGDSIHVAWTVRQGLLASREVQLWAAHSRDGGKSFSEARQVYRVARQDDLRPELFQDAAGRVGAVWSEVFPPKLDRTPGGGRLVQQTFWDGRRYLESASPVELSVSDEFHYSDLRLASRAEQRLVLVSELSLFQPTRVKVFWPAGEGWGAITLEAKTPGYDARGPVAFVKESDSMYTIVFHEIRRHQFYMEPAAWDTGILWGQYTFEDSSGAAR